MHKANVLADIQTLRKRVRQHDDPEPPQAKRQLPLFPYSTGGLAGRYADSVIAWRSAAGVKAPVRRPETSEPDAEQRWEEEGGSGSSVR